MNLSTDKPKTFKELLDQKYGQKETESRMLFEAKAEAFYLCEMLKEERKKATLTQEQLAELLHLKKSFISRVENGKVDVQLSTFLKMLRGVGLELTLTPRAGIS